MAKKVVKEDEHNIMFHHTGMTSFTGCRCFYPCLCRKNFIPEKYNFYVIKSDYKKTTQHSTLKEANARWDFICALGNNES